MVSVTHTPVNDLDYSAAEYGHVDGVPSPYTLSIPDGPLTDEQAMRLALDAARCGIRGANPLVGAVITGTDGRVLYVGWHRGAGTPHAEADALAQAFEGSAGAFLMTPPSMPGRDDERMLGLQLANAAATAGVGHIVFSTLENVEQRSGGTKYAPHFTDKAKVADHIRSLGVPHTFVMLAFFYTNLLEYYVPRMDGDTLLMPIYLPEDFRAPFVDPLTATGPAVLEILSNPAHYQGRTMPVVGEMISPREMVEAFQRVTGVKAEYRNAYTRGGLLQYFPQFAENQLLVEELLGMVSHAVEHGYFDASLDLDWSRKVNPDMLDWEGFLRRTGWRGQQMSFGA